MTGRAWTYASATNPTFARAVKPRFLPTARQTNWLLCVDFLSVGYALWLRYRALAIEVDRGYLWFWIGSHADYDKIIG